MTLAYMEKIKKTKRELKTKTENDKYANLIEETN